MRLLLIEDDLDLGHALAAALTTSSVEIVWVRRLAEAYAQLLAGSFHAAVLDINLPDGEGFSLLDKLRQKKLLLPVIVVTAREALGDRLKAFSLGADDYVIKPFSVEELMARINAVTRRASGYANEELQVGAISLSQSRREVKVIEQDTYLTPLEFKLLEHMMLAVDRVTTREVLWNVLWGPSEEPSNTSLEVLIHGLRKKLNTGQIKTVRGVGYMLMNS
jgi:two-component system, OmpR family, response regulator QseB